MSTSADTVQTQQTGEGAFYLPATPQPEGAERITAIETVIPDNLMPALLLVRIHTERGHVGHGETYYAPHAVAAMIHDWMARRLLGADALAIEAHWRFLYERAANFGVRGAELRAISALDVALWDILGQVCGQPIYRLLGGPVRSEIPVYNSCGNPRYGRLAPGVQGWPGYGALGEPGPLSDSYNLFHHPVELAEELVEEGFGAMKVWPFDGAAHRHGGMRIPLDELEASVKPLRDIRAKVGERIELLVDGHGFFMLPAALRIAEALRDVRPLWLEDILKMDNIETLADFRRQSGMPISASEMLLSRADFARVLEAKAADYVMIDPTWAGGISETVRLAHLAQAYNVPVTMHDCTGPLTLFAGLHVNAAVPGCAFQETVRAHIRTLYDDLVEPNVQVQRGAAALPSGPGLGTRLNPELFTEARATYRISRAN
ncbi:MAG: mandelate racemase/muconate lactonizing enzyme family protein [Phycisphaeraceae bacterium]